MSFFTGALKSNTMHFSVATIALGLLTQFTDVIPALVPAQYNGLAVAGIGLVTALLRMKTTTALSDK